MTDHTNNGCSCTPNTSIRCAVTNCANHCKDAQYCGLNAIQVGQPHHGPVHRLPELQEAVKALQPPLRRPLHSIKRR